MKNMWNFSKFYSFLTFREQEKMIDLLTWLSTSLVSGVILIFIWWKFYFCKRNYDIEFLPGDWPLIGNVLQLLDQEKFRTKSDEMYKKSDGTFGFYLMTKRLVNTCNVDVLKDLLSSPKHIKKSWGYVFLEPLLVTRPFPRSGSHQKVMGICFS